MNNVSLVGRLTKDPEKRSAKNGTSCCMFQLAVDRGLRSASGDKVVDFIPCSAWSVSCDFLCKYAHKGDMLSLTGRIQTRSSVEPNGTTRFIVEVIVTGLTILNPRPQERPEPKKERPKEEEEEDYSGLPFM